MFKLDSFILTILINSINLLAISAWLRYFTLISFSLSSRYFLLILRCSWMFILLRFYVVSLNSWWLVSSRPKVLGGRGRSFGADGLRLEVPPMLLKRVECEGFTAF